MPRKEITKLVGKETDRACRELSDRLKSARFTRSRKMFWTRLREHTVEFFHIHRHGISYGAPLNASVSLRVHLGIRVLNDDFDGPALNGPMSDDVKYRSGRYHFRFNAKSGSTFDRCVDDLERFIRDEAEPWFKEFRSERALIRSKSSPLTADSQQLLIAALDGRSSPENVAASLKMFGIKKSTD